MSSGSNVYCCVPLCNQKGNLDSHGNRVGLFSFPKDPNLRSQWLRKIRRDVGKDFTLIDLTKVCSLHFDKSEIKTGLGKKRMNLRTDAIPTKFAWRTERDHRHRPEHL